MPSPSRARLGLTVLCAALAVPAAAGSRTAEPATARTLLAAINAARVANGLAPLRVDRALTRAARAHSRDMLRRGYFAHGRVAVRLASFHVRGRWLGENLAWGANVDAQSQFIVSRWLASRPHRANLLRPAFRRVGIAALTGPFAGAADARVVTADFAS